MSRPTTPSPRASRASERFVLEPATSRWLLVGWVMLHATACAAVAALERGVAVTAVGAVGLIAHAALRRPRRPPAVARLPSGRWSVPAAGLGAAEPLERTRYTRYWARLVLRDRSVGRDLTILLMRDQLDDESWRRLQTALRRGNGERGAERSTDFG